MQGQRVANSPPPSFLLLFHCGLAGWAFDDDDDEAAAAVEGLVDVRVVAVDAEGDDDDDAAADFLFGDADAIMGLSPTSDPTSDRRSDMSRVEVDVIPRALMALST